MQTRTYTFTIFFSFTSTLQIIKIQNIYKNYIKQFKNYKKKKQRATEIEAGTVLEGFLGCQNSGGVSFPRAIATSSKWVHAPLRERTWKQ